MAEVQTLRALENFPITGTPIRELPALIEALAAVKEAAALANQEPALVARTPGVGKRTAEKIVLELKDKVKAPATGLESLAQLTTADGEVMDALVALGYSVVEAQRAVQKLPKDVTTIEERLRMALSQFQ